jgi:hypothetical protein
MMEPTSFAKLFGTVFIPSLEITTSIQPFIWHFSKRSFHLTCPQGISAEPRAVCQGGVGYCLHGPGVGARHKVE